MAAGLLERILYAQPGILVDEIVRPAILVTLPLRIRDRFARREIRWLDTREALGLEFDLASDEPIDLGHVRGHHIAMHPEWHGLAEDEAEWIVTRELEGVLLHELGHAVLERFGRMHAPRIGAHALAVVALAHDRALVSTYPAGDRHEAFAESFRWWAMARPAFERAHPRLATLIDQLTAVVERSLG